MTSPPLVSIAIPAYKHSEFIEACLASVCAQTYPELELILIDDGSPDDTFARAQKFIQNRTGRFRRIVLERCQNRGVSANSNACIEASRGEWVHLLGSDDLLYPTKVESIQGAITQWNDPNLALVHADCDFIGADGRAISRSRQKPRPAPGPDPSATQWLFLGEHFIFNPTVTLHRKRFLELGGFDHTLPLEDWDCWLRLSLHHSIARVPEVLASYRKHPGNSNRQRLKMLAALFRTFSKFLKDNPRIIQDADLKSHFRAYVWRSIRRLRKQAPGSLPELSGYWLSSFIHTPGAAEYGRLADLLEHKVKNS